MSQEESILVRMRRQQFSNAAPEEEDSILARMRKKAEEAAKPKPLPPGSEILGTLGIVSNMDDANRIGNRVRNIGRILETGYGVLSGQSLTPDQLKLLETLDKGVEVTDTAERKAMSDIGHMFSSTDNIKDAVKSLWSSTKEAVNSPDKLKAIARMPVGMLTSIVSDAFGASSGIRLNDAKEIKVLDPEEAAAKVKATIGNIVSTAAIPLIEAGVASTMARSVGGGLKAAEMMTAPIEDVAAISSKTPKIGRIGEAIIKDATAAAGAGMIQGGIANANQSDTFAKMATGLLFAPIGALTGWYRGVKGGPSIGEMLTTEAHDVMQLRQMQEMQNASVESLVTRVSDIMSADDIEQVLAKDSHLPEWLYKKLRREGRDPNRALNDYDINDPNVIQAVKIDPSLTAQQKENVLKTGSIHGQFPRGRVEELFPTFESKYLKEGTNFGEAVLKFASDHKLSEHVSEINEKFADQYIKKYAPSAGELESVLSSVRNIRKMSGGFAEADILDVANQAGMYVTNEHGRLLIRDIETGERVGVAQTTHEAIDMMKQMGKEPNPVLHDAGAELPTHNIDGLATPISQPHMQTWEPEQMDHRVGTGITAIDKHLPNVNANDMMHNFDLKINPLTGMNAFIEAIDGRNWATAGEDPIKTNLKKIFLEVEHSKRLTDVAIRKDLTGVKLKFLDSYVRSKVNKLSTSDLEYVGKALEAQSWDEMVKPDGYAKGFTVSKEAQDLARFAHENNIDLTKVLSYRRSQSALKYEAMRRVEAKAKQNFEMNIANKMDKDDAWQIFRDESEAWDSHPVVSEGQARLEQIFKPDENFNKANTMFDGLHTKPDATAHSSAAVRLKLALDDPKHYGLNEADFIKEHNFTPAQVKTLEMVKEQYEHYRKEFGISDSRKMMRYMNHYRQFGDLIDDNIISDFEKGILDPTMRQFASSMIRTGEIANYSQNPITNLYSYIRGGRKAQNIYKTLGEQFSNLEAPLREELAKITNPSMRELVEKRLTDYQRDVTGQVSLGTKENQSIHAHYLKTLVKDENGAVLTNAQIISEMQKPSNIDTMLNLQASGLLGGRVSLAMRDNLDVLNKFYIKHGSKRLWELVTTKVPQRRINELIREGYIVDPEGIDVYNVVHESATGKLGSATKDIANLGYKMSLQHHYYVKNQAAVWEHTYENTIKTLKKLSTGIIKDKKSAYKDLFMNGYDEQTQKMFDAYVRDGSFGAAARLLATEETREMVGYFTRGNQAPILNSKGGKMFGQMGSWAMTNRSVMQNLLSRGTRKELAERYARFGIANSAIMLAGAATGFNLSRWMLLPTSLVTSGGPIINAIEAATSGINAQLGGDPKQTSFTNRAMTRSLQQFIPFEAAASDLYKSYQLQNSGMNYGPGRTAGQAIGIPVVKNRQNMLDIVLGNYPISWDK